VDEQAEELKALRELFPDYSDDFADLERAKERRAWELKGGIDGGDGEEAAAGRDPNPSAAP